MISDPIFQRHAEHLVALGPRAVAEFLAELAREHDLEADIRRRLASYRRATPELLIALGGDRFPPKVWRAA